MLDLSDKIELRLLAALIKQVNAATSGRPYLLAGATARDLLLVCAHGIPNNRATEDLDLAFLMDTWEEFDALRNRLLAKEFSEVPHKGIHKLRFRGNLEVDILPFGAIERADRSIAWPPDNAFVMTMFGFQEAVKSSITVMFPDDAQVQVVSLPALAILKFSAWTDRRLTEPRKDAYDLLLIIRNYSDVSGDRLYVENPYVTGSPSDYEAAGAWLLGKDMAQLLDENGRERLARIIADEANEMGQLRLVGDMRHDPDRALTLLAAMEEGFAAV